MSGYLLLDRLTRRFAAGAGVVDLSLSLGRGETLALLGPSGSGKTTTLRLLAGFETPDRGRIVVDGDDVTGRSPARRRFGMVFQHYALFPHLSVGENVGFGLAHIPQRERAARVAEALQAVDLEGFEPRAVDSLSGGQQQRVALARAIAPEPLVLLLDEPLSNLDPALRERTRRELRQLIDRIGITTVLVTHEQDEAFELADRIAVLNAGSLDQVGSAEDLYDRPATAFVASFVGRSTAVPAVFEAGGWRVAGSLPVLPGPAGSAGDRATLVARPEAFRLAPESGGWASGTVTERRFTGAVAFYRVALGGAGEPALEIVDRADRARVGDRVGIVPTGRELFVFPERAP